MPAHDCGVASAGLTEWPNTALTSAGGASAAQGVEITVAGPVRVVAGWPASGVTLAPGAPGAPHPLSESKSTSSTATTGRRLIARKLRARPGPPQ